MLWTSSHQALEPDPRWRLVLSLFLSTCYLVALLVEPPNNGHVGDKHFVHCLDVVPSSEIEMYGQYIGRGRTV